MEPALLLSPIGDPQLAAQEADELVTAREPARRPGRDLDDRLAAAATQELDELGQGGQRDPRLAVDRAARERPRSTTAGAPSGPRRTAAGPRPPWRRRTARSPRCRSRRGRSARRRRSAPRRRRRPSASAPSIVRTFAISCSAAISSSAARIPSDGSTAITSRHDARQRQGEASGARPDVQPDVVRPGERPQPRQAPRRRSDPDRRGTAMLTGP